MRIHPIWVIFICKIYRCKAHIRQCGRYDRRLRPGEIADGPVVGGGVAAPGEEDTAGVIPAHHGLLVNDVHDGWLQGNHFDFEVLD